ncbi:hypothetical protein D3C81_2155900 [compost metagenome]
MNDFPYGLGRLKYLPEHLEVVLCIVRINFVLIPVNPAKTGPHLHRTHSVPFCCQGFLYPFPQSAVIYKQQECVRPSILQPGVR